MVLSTPVIPQRKSVWLPSHPASEPVGLMDVIEQHVQQCLALKWMHAFDMGCESGINK
jgi:hypothetical protein